MSKPDNREDNAQRIRRNIETTRNNMEIAEHEIEITSDPHYKQQLQEKNQRRAAIIPDLFWEMKEEEAYQDLKHDDKAST
ncbi:MAG: small acid-soluble spore protein Tlp [Clostridiales bacterium]|nr:small acid-soluble spore protein Tlp [Clostridiales bacterium]